MEKLESSGKLNWLNWQVGCKDCTEHYVEMCHDCEEYRFILLKENMKKLEEKLDEHLKRLK